MRLLENNIGENLDGFGYDDLKKKNKKNTTKDNLRKKKMISWN